MKILKASDPNAFPEALKVLQEGGVILYPTDTLYGLGIDVSNQQALEKIHDLKGRKSSQPVSFMTDMVDQIEAYHGLLPMKIRYALDLLFPGKITALLENTIKSSLSLPQLLREQKKIGWRIPDHPFCLALSSAYGKPISSTSANLSGRGNQTHIEEILAQLNGQPDLVIDDGPITKNRGSTILDFTKKPLMIVRQGEVTKRELQQVLPGQKFLFKKHAFEIVFVCSGNICRSPMAEGILKALLAKTRYKNLVHVSSAGTLSLPPTPVHNWAEKVAAANEINIHSHISNPVSEKLMDRADLVIGLAADHIRFLKKKYPGYIAKIILLKEWKRAKILTNPSVADPIGHEINFFADTFAEIHSEIKRILPQIFLQLKKFMDYQDLQV